MLTYIRPLLLLAVILPLIGGCTAIKVVDAVGSAAVDISVGTIKVAGTAAAAAGRTVIPGGNKDKK